MKILKTNNFISERIKVQPVTNAELNKAQNEMNNFKKIENPTFDDIKEGRAVCVRTGDKETIYIVFDSTNLSNFIKTDATEHRMHIFDRPLFFARYDIRFNDIVYDYPYCYEERFPYKNTKISGYEYYCEIVGIYDANINTTNIQSFQDFKNEWYSVCKKIENYK